LNRTEPPTSANAEQFTHSRLYDLAAAAPLVLVYGFAATGNLILISRQWQSARDPAALLTIINETMTILFFGLQIGLCLFRRLPLAKSEGLWPRAVAVLGANLNFTLLLLPRVVLSGHWAVIAAALTIAGTLASVAVLIYLGRSFSILPEARKLVTGGPYRLIRHPLYLTEMISSLGIMLQFQQPWSMLVVVVAIALQIRRMLYEEDILRQSFPAYDAYKQRTARLIPGIY
jgi:protein-S-isoprenylcysteine O-methyltransferase Ste14